MTHHLLPEVDRAALAPFRHAHLIRDPRELLASYARVRTEPTLADLGLAQQAEIFETFGGPVVDSRDLLADPEGILRALCQALGVPFDARMLAWPPGPRDTDGVWAPYWYDSVRSSTGFTPYRPPAEPAARPPRAPRRKVHAVLLAPAPATASPARARIGDRVLQVFDERNRDLIVNVGGKLTHRDRAAVSPFDSVVQGGDAVWEGLRLYDGKIFRLDEHLARLRASARALAFGQIPVRRGDHRADQAHARPRTACGTACTSGSPSPAGSRSPRAWIPGSTRPGRR